MPLIHTILWEDRDSNGSTRLVHNNDTIASYWKNYSDGVSYEIETEAYWGPACHCLAGFDTEEEARESIEDFLYNEALDNDSIKLDQRAKAVIYYIENKA